MKKFICPVCDQSDIVKENDLFVCQGCGTKYHAEEVRKAINEADSVAEVYHDMNYDKPENILARSVPATSKINDSNKQFVRNSFVVALIPLFVPVITILINLMSGEDLEYFFKHLSGIDAFFFWGSILLSFVLFVYALSSDNKADEETKEAQISAQKEQITVTNLKIFGSTSARDFSIPCSEIKHTYIERITGKSSIRINNEVLCIVCEKETLRFEYLENNSEISNAIKTVIPRDMNDNGTNNNDLSNNAANNNVNNNEVYNIKVGDYISYFPAIKAVREITLMDYVYAKRFLNDLPAVLVENISKEKADKYARILEQNDVNFEIYLS